MFGGSYRLVSVDASTRAGCVAALPIYVRVKRFERVCGRYSGLCLKVASVTPPPRRRRRLSLFGSC